MNIVISFVLITPDSITHYFIKLFDENELPHIIFHELRHSCISLLANNTAFSVKQVQDYAGHSDFLTTSKIYIHAIQSADEIASNALEDKLKLEKRKDNAD